MAASSSDDQAGSPSSSTSAPIQDVLQAGGVIPAHPLALTAERGLDERRQRALSRYYAASGVHGMAVGVHTTQFAIHDPTVGLLPPVLELAAEEMDRADDRGDKRLIRVAGICGPTEQAHREAQLARDLGYHLGLLSLTAMRGSSLNQLLEHCRRVAEEIDLFGFYLQPAVGGVDLPYEFWRAFCDIEQVAAIKIAPFDRYRTLALIRAVAESGREDIALYTGNDDNIILDLLTPYAVARPAGRVARRMVGGLLGHWAVWTSQALQHWQRCRQAVVDEKQIDRELLDLAVAVTDANAVIFDAANAFRGCIPGIHEILRRQGLLAGIWCLNEDEVLSPGQAAELDRIESSYPHLVDNAFVQQHLDGWLSG